MKKQPISIYYLGTMPEESDTVYEDFIKDISGLDIKSIDASINFDAKLFVKQGEEKPPSWESFLKPGFPGLSLPESRTISAVLILNKMDSETRHWFACTFGAGRFLLNPARIQRNFGLKATLNAIYDVAVPDNERNRIRSVTSKTVSHNTLHTKRQTDANALFEFFGVDSNADFLKKVSGKPFNESLGSMMTGSDSVTARIDSGIEGLDKICIFMLDLSAKNIYKDRFEWIDKIQSVSDNQIQEKLVDLVASKLRNNDLEGLTLTIPQILNWEYVHHIEASWMPDQEFQEVKLDQLVSFLEEEGTLQNLEGEHLKKKYKLLAKDDMDDLLGGGSLLKCIAGEIIHNGVTYILSEGEFYEIEQNFLEALDQEIENISESSADLPPSPGDKKEGDYNEDAANHSDKHLLLDKKTVRINTRTSPIEICDVLTADKQMIHVKRKLGSSSLSHLFSQGFVSGDLLVTNVDYRMACVKKIDEAAQERKPGDTSYRDQFNFIQTNSVDPSEIEVVYAIAAKWKQRSLAEALPFFSKVNLRRFSQDLRRMGYKVTHSRIDAS
jgi:uncharacterized protein (TIGR04141 family)